MSDIHAITVPKWGMNMQEGKVLNWLVNEGDSISVGDEIVEIESEKIVNVLEAIVAGVLRRQLVGEDALFPVGKLLAVVADESVSDADIDAFVKEREAAFAEELEQYEDQMAEPTFVELNGRRIEYIAGGEGALCTVFIHGMGGQKEAWAITQGLVSGLGKTLAIDLPGHGGSAKSVDTGDLDELAGYILGTMDTLDIASAHFVGHSLGAVIAAHIAKEHPQRANSVFLISAVGAGTVVSPEFLQNFGKAESRKEVKAALMPLFVDKKMVSKDIVQAVLKIKRIEGANECLQMIGDKSGTALAPLDPADTLAAIAVPISVVWGELDKVCALRNTQCLPDGVKLTVIEGAGHMVQLERVSEVNELILEHISASS